ncbi:hypothetical protein E1293_20690 [Actinomadura darangshiensis]|uniref:Uncharacterized protein n=1 Tax=Actinomadura darangshiensis TaxID=705336 RepID=A0A4R5BAI5_9ACTN|nr:hypothetical protein [Actinomadura darangshiensis]TDD80432.1 hypothetical protein E1293_20690 [Actinomadura darangshiensis]
MFDLMIPWMSDLLHFPAHLAYGTAAHLSLPDIGVHEPRPPLEDPGIPDPGKGTAPPLPIADKILLIMKWGAWTGLAACVTGYVIIGARMAIRHQKGEGGGHIASVVIVTFATMLIVSAQVLVSKISG